MKRVAALSAVGLVAAVLAIPSAASAASVSFSCKGAATTDITKPVTSSCSGAPFGTFKALVDSSKVPTVTYKLSVKGGTVNLVATTVLKSSEITGTWKATGGTGKYKKAKGKGTLTGALKAGAPFTFKGSMSW